MFYSRELCCLNVHFSLIYTEWGNWFAGSPDICIKVGRANLKNTRLRLNFFHVSNLSKNSLCSIILHQEKMHQFKPRYLKRKHYSMSTGQAFLKMPCYFRMYTIMAFHRFLFFLIFELPWHLEKGNTCRKSPP